MNTCFHINNNMKAILVILKVHSLILLYIINNIELSDITTYILGGAVYILCTKFKFYNLACFIYLFSEKSGIL